MHAGQLLETIIPVWTSACILY